MQYDLGSLINKLIEGFYHSDLFITGKNLRRGRFREERDLEIYVKSDEKEFLPLRMKIFMGRKPYYRQWIELYDISPYLNISKRKAFFGSELEFKLNRLIHDSLEPAGKLLCRIY